MNTRSATCILIAAAVLTSSAGIADGTVVLRGPVAGRATKQAVNPASSWKVESKQDNSGKVVANAGRAETIAVRLHDGPIALRIDEPDAQASAAREAAVAAAGANAPVWTLTSRIVVRARDTKSLSDAAAKLGVKPSLLAFTSKWPAPCFTVDAASVRAAALLAAQLGLVPGVVEAYVDAIDPLADRGVPTDPLIGSQWHLMNALNPLADLNIEPAWNAGFTGAGVTVGVLEGGWNIEHTDLAPKYHVDASQEGESYSNHATSVAGIVAATANNAMGGAGVAYDAMLSRLYYGTDSANATAFAFRNDLNDVKSNSWGPSDIGRAWVMSALQRQAITDAATLGRDGKGTVFVWAAGNGRATNNDRVDYDPWASHPWVIAVGSVGHTDTLATYSEPGSSVMVVAPSRRTLSGGGDPGIVTTTDQSDYTTLFGGTSAAAPMAAGVVALMLEANPALSVRDVMHILIDTARKCDPANASWYLNAAGRWTSDDYGFGAIDAAAAVAAAQTWTGVGALQSWSSGVQTVMTEVTDNEPASMGGGVSSTIHVSRRMRCERAIVELTLPHASIGQLRATLTSPGGSVSRLATIRTDTVTNRYVGYVFTSLRHWGETTNGAWTLKVSDEVAGTVGTFESWRLEFLGSAVDRLADWDGSGFVDLTDLLDFVEAWIAGDGDVNGDEIVELNDLLDFIEVWVVEYGT